MGEETGQVRNILEPSHETDILQSFVRVDLGDESEAEAVAEIKKKLEQIQYQQKKNLIVNEDKIDRAARRDSEEAPINKTTFNQLAKDMKLDGIQKRKARTGQGECYTDKDRAAAYNMGSKDIKQSLKIKQREDRSKSLMTQEDVDPASVLALGYHELRSGNVPIAISYINKALELNPDDRNALVARSKCYLLLGQPKMALADAETALISDKNYIKAIFQKAEALYHLGDFEHSLMYYHRGLRIRPELAGFRLGVQKTQEAIENTIGVAARPVKRNSASKKYTMGITLDEKGIEISPSTRSRPKTSNSRNRMDAEKRNSKRLLGELHLDKEYLENLLVHPDIKCLFKDKEDITGHAKEAIEFLNGRQEFWRQQRPTVAPKKKTRTKSQARSVSAHPHSRLQRPQ